VDYDHVATTPSRLCR